MRRYRAAGQREVVVLPQRLRLRLPAEHPDQHQPAGRGDGVLRAAQDLLSQDLRRQVLDEVVQEPEGRAPGGRGYAGGKLNDQVKIRFSKH